MRISSILMFVCAVVLAGFAGLLAQTWLEQQRGSGQQVVVEKRLETGRIVVAAQPLRFGSELSGANIREIEWPAGAVPPGAFTSVAELLKANERRVALAAIEPNEPVLKWKITGPGQRASLSAVLEPGMKAVTIRVNDVNGIAGFVLPGDRVDVMLTRTEGTANDKKEMFTDVLLQHVRVLGIDQLADDRSDKPIVVKAVTLEVGTEDGQRLALAGNVGTLSLALRPAGATGTDLTQRVTADDLGTGFQVASAAPQAAPAAAVTERAGKVYVTRGVTRTEYTVPVENRVAKAVHRMLATNQ